MSGSGSRDVSGHVIQDLTRPLTCTFMKVRSNSSLATPRSRSSSLACLGLTVSGSSTQLLGKPVKLLGLGGVVGDHPLSEGPHIGVVGALEGESALLDLVSPLTLFVQR